MAKNAFLSVVMAIAMAACTGLPPAVPEGKDGSGGGADLRYEHGIPRNAIAGYVSAEQNALSRVLPQTEDAHLDRREDRLEITLGSDSLFDPDSYELKPGTHEQIRRVAEVLNQYPATRLLICSHTDSEGSEQYNQTLTEKRVQAVKSFLLSNKVVPQRIETAGYGETRPLYSNATERGRALNRRTTIEIIPIASR